MNTVKDFTAADIDPAATTAYHADRGNTAWTDAAPQEQAQAITRAWDYIRIQPFDPALDVFRDGLPEDITRAVYEAALVELELPGSLLKKNIADETPKLLKVGSLQIDYGSTARKDHYEAVETLLNQYLITQFITLKR